MGCKSIRKQFSEYIDGRLNAAETAEVVEHIKGCRVCREELNSLKAVVLEIRGLSKIHAPANFASRLHHQLESERPYHRLAQWFSAPFRFKIPLGFAAATAAAVVMIFMIQARRTDNGPLNYQPAEMKKNLHLDQIRASEKKSADLPIALETGQQAKEQRRLPKEERGKGVASAPEPVLGEPLKNLQWVLTLNASGVTGSEGFNQDGDKEKQYAPMKDMNEAVNGIKALTGRLGGKVLSVKQNPGPAPECLMSISIPKSRLQAFSTELGRMGRINVRTIELSEHLPDPATVHLKLAWK